MSGTVREYLDWKDEQRPKEPKPTCRACAKELTGDERRICDKCLDVLIEMIRKA